MSETLSEIVGKVEFDIEMKAIGMAVLKELARQNFRIAELEAELKNARELIGMTPEPAFPEWIPVSERLPEKDGYYLVYDDKYDQYFDALFRHSAWTPAIYNSVVTHWMPLPEPPEAK